MLTPSIPTWSTDRSTFRVLTPLTYASSKTATSLALTAAAAPGNDGKSGRSQAELVCEPRDLVGGYVNVYTFASHG